MEKSLAFYLILHGKKKIGDTFHRIVVLVKKLSSSEGPGGNVAKRLNCPATALALPQI